MSDHFVAYYRVSTIRQGRSGLGLDAQRQAVANYLKDGRWDLVGEFTEVESGKSADRPKLSQAIDLCRLTGARLVIAKLDRLSRDVHFLSGLEKAGIDFVCADMPSANKFTINIMAAVAQQEREATSARTVAALATIKKRIAQEGSYTSRSGRTITRLGNPDGLSSLRPDLGVAAVKARADEFASRIGPTIQDLRARGLSFQAIADRLNLMRVRTSRGGPWAAMQVKRAVDRVQAFHPSAFAGAEVH